MANEHDPKNAWEGKGLDEHAANELFLWIENDGDLYRRQTVPIHKNLTIKKARGVYDHVKAIKLFGYLAESGAKRYDEEVNGAPRGKGRIPPEFPKKVREAVAEELTDRFETEHALGNYSNYLPKKYQYAVGGKKGKTRKASGAEIGGTR